MHIINDLGQGGAEMVLARLIAATADTHQHSVVSLHSEGVLAGELRQLGATVESLNMPRGRFSWRALRHLVALVQAATPDVMQTRMHHANLVGSLVVMRAMPVPVIWAVHATELGTWGDSWKTVLVRAACVPLSYWQPRGIVFDSERSRRMHMRLGYRHDRCRLIDNGVNTTRFAPDAARRAAVRTELGVGEGDVLIGCVARWDPLKDHANLIAALRTLKEQHISLRCLLVGRGMDSYNESLVQLLTQRGVVDTVILAGSREDIPDVMNALDLHVLASRSESAPVTVAEAMSCGTPCVVTEVGDAARMVGATGWVVPSRDPPALAHALATAITATKGVGRAKWSEMCRKRALDHFGLEAMSVQYRELWDSVIQRTTR